MIGVYYLITLNVGNKKFNIVKMITRVGSNNIVVILSLTI